MHCFLTQVLSSGRDGRDGREGPVVPPGAPGKSGNPGILGKPRAKGALSFTLSITAKEVHLLDFLGATHDDPDTFGTVESNTEQNG